MTNKYTSGDLVEAVKGETVIRGRAHEVTALGSLAIGEYTAAITWYERHGFTVTIIEKAPPKVVLPTEPGFYLTAYYDPDVFELDQDGEWYYGDTLISVERVIHDGGNSLTRLEPVPETAKKVLERIRSDSNGDGGHYDHRYTARQLRDLFAEFGVTE